MKTEILEKLSSIEQVANRLEDKVATAQATRKTGVIGNAPAPAPYARKGESIMSSRGFQFGKAIGCLGKNGNIMPEDAKVELEFCHRFTKKMHQAGYQTTSNNSVLVPMSPDFFPADLVDETEYHEIKGLIHAGVNGLDDDEYKHWSQRYGQKAAATPAMSWIDQSVGGAFVPPQMFGPPIELLRANECMMAAGATVIPLGPSGRISFPRLVGATQAGWSPENNQQTPNVPTTGQLELSAKKVIGVVVLPGELLRFGSAATEAIIRNDLFKTVSLVADKGFLEGPGSNNQPLGLATMGAAAGNPFNLAIVTPTNSNQLAAQDVYQFLANIEEQNGLATSWIMRPKMAYAFYQSRWTPYSSGTSQGGFLFELVRGLEGEMTPYLSGLKVVRSTNVSANRGNGAQTYILCLNAPDYYVGLFGAIEFSQSDSGYTFLSSDQVGIRAILSCDGAPRHPGQVAFCDSLNFVVAD